MSAMSNYLEGKLVEHTLRNVAFTSPTTVYVALFTSTATLAELEAGTLTNEVANAAAYARTAVTFGAHSNGLCENSAAVTFPTATGSWGTVRFFAIMDGNTHGVGNVLVFGQLTADKTITTDDVFQFPIGNLDVTFS